MRPETEPGDRRNSSRFHEDPNRLADDPGRLILGAFAPLAPRFRRLSYIPDKPPLNRALAPRMRPATESGDRLDFSRFHEAPHPSAANPGRLILGPFAPLAPRFSRLSYISDTPPLNLALSPRMRPETDPDHRPNSSRFREDPIRSAVDPGRLILGTFAPLAPRFRRLSYISDTPPLNLALAPRMRPATESGDRLDFSRFREDPNRLAVDPGRLILWGNRPNRASYSPTFVHLGRAPS